MSLQETQISKLAVVSPLAKLGVGVRIEPFAVVHEDVEIGDGCRIDSHAVIRSGTRMGEGNRVGSFSSLGGDPQDLKYAGEECWLEIGDNNDIREHVTMNRGTAGDKLVTRVGDNCLFQAMTHLGHDSQIGNQVIFGSGAMCAGHTVIEDKVILSGQTGVHQFVRVGTGAMIGAKTFLSQDAVPYCLVDGKTQKIEGLNVVGLRRRGVERQVIQELKQAFDVLFGDQGVQDERLRQIEQQFASNAVVQDLVDFVRNRTSGRGLVPTSG